MDRIYRVKNGMGGRYAIERDGNLFWLEGDLFGQYRTGGEVGEGKQTFVAPVRPSKVMAIGLNYKDHAAEMKKALPEEPLVFMKPASSVIGPEQPIDIPAWAGRIDHEAEMAVVIGAGVARSVRESLAMDYVLGVTCLNDVTARDLQEKDVQYSARQGLRYVCDRSARASRLASTPRISRSKDGSTVRSGQSSNTNQLIFQVPALVEFVTRFCTLEPGDIITTGTPSGVAPLKAGDRVMVKVDGVGTLSNPCVAA